MAPILLKIKGTKLFSPFNEIEDVGDLSTLWRVCTKVKDSLENGSRLENLSWRLWHLHQTLEARGKGKDYRKLSPATTRQLEKTIRRPDSNVRKPKPMQIKVRLGKSPADNRPTESVPSQTNGRIRPLAAAGTHRAHSPLVVSHSATDLATSLKQHNASSDAISSSANSSNGSGLSGVPQTDDGNLASAGSVGVVSAVAGDSSADGSALLADIDPALSNVGAGCTASTAAATTATMPLPPAAPSANSALAIPAYTPHSAEVVGSGFGNDASNHCSGSSSAHGANGASSNTPSGDNAEEPQASDFMSFGPSSFLSSGFDLDAPQIEITLDDIFSATPSDWSQFGFGSLGSGPALGLPMGEYGAGQGMWNGMPYPGAMPAGAPYGVGHHMHMAQEQAKKHDGPICDNCEVTSTPLWRRSADDTLLCNACGLYYKLHHSHRPRSLRTGSGRKDGAEEDLPKTFCSNCKTSNTPLWRRDEKANPLCNACGLYYKLHKENRPITLKTDVIRKRQRYDAASTTTPRKRTDRGAQKLAAASAVSPDELSPSSTPPAVGISAAATTNESNAAGSMGPPKEVPQASPSSRSRKGKGKPTSLAVKTQTLPVGIQSPPPSSSAKAPAYNGQAVADSTETSHMACDLLTPQSVPPVSYSANGTQLLNSTEPSSYHAEVRHGYHSHHQSSAATGHFSRSPPPLQSVGEYRRSFALSNATTALPPPPPPPSLQLAHSYNAAVAQDSHSLTLQHSATLPPAHRYSSASRIPNSSASINIPMSPPLCARPDAYFGRPPSAGDRPAHDTLPRSPGIQIPLPPLGSAQSSSGRYGSGGGAGLSQAHSFQAGMSTSGQQQLPSLAELQSSAPPGARSGDTFRYARQQQTSYPPLNP